MTSTTDVTRDAINVDALPLNKESSNTNTILESIKKTSGINSICCCKYIL
jgi:hypothetical protein